MRIPRSCPAPLAVLALVSAPVLAVAFPVAVAADESKAGAICREAEERYVELFGHPSAEEEGVSVVTMYKYHFCPAAITVKPGTTVRWVNVDKRTSHSVLVPKLGLPESDRAFPEEIIEMTFLTAGDYEYLCGPHWESHDMIAMVTVAE